MDYNSEIFLKKFNWILELYFYAIKLKLESNWMFFYVVEGWIECRETEMQNKGDTNNVFKFICEIYFVSHIFFCYKVTGPLHF